MKQRNGQGAHRGGEPQPNAVVQRASAWAVVVGTALLLTAAGASGALVLKHLGALSVPGCGPGGACDEALRSPWGKIPVGSYGWPVAFVGLSYFLAALAGWLVAGGALPGLLRQVVRLGALGSAFFCVIIVHKGLPCPYCIAAHVANFGFWITTELTRVRARRWGPALGAGALIFLVTSGALGAADAWRRAQVARKGERERSESTAEIIRRSREPEPTGQPAPATRPEAPSAATQPSAAPPQSVPAAETRPAPSQAESAPATKPFTGRWRLGPEEAAIRILVITDFQCPDCRQIEGQIKQVLQKHQSVSVSMKHFPFCQDCNPYAPRTIHPNACWAARAAEAAGILYGNEGFWKMHDWLFERRGSFTTTKELEDGIRLLGYDPTGFVRTMTSEETLRRVREDCDEAEALGLFFTPMIFINGVELKGWYQPNALIRTVDEVAATNPPPRTAAWDRPPRAFEKYIADWADEPVRQLPADQTSWTLGPADAPVRVVLWGDYQEAGTVAADRIIRAYAARSGKLRYTYRHAPFNAECNPGIPFRRHPLACWAARAAEAAGRLGGNEAYWKMHAWLMENHEVGLRAAAAEANLDVGAVRGALYTMSEEDRKKAAAKVGLDVERALQTMQRAADEALRLVASEMGFDTEALLAAMQREDVQAAITEDWQAGKALPVLRYGAPAGLHGIPTIFVNDKYVPRWRMGDDTSVLERILAKAAEQ